jgi:hypothetical protein
MLVRMWGKRNLHPLWVGMKSVQLLWTSVWRFLKKLTIELSYDPAIPLLVMFLKECKSTYSGDTCTPMFIASLFVGGFGKEEELPGGMRGKG